MVAGLLEPVVVFWTRWGIHATVLLSFTLQLTLLLLTDLRRRYDWVVLKVLVWSAYMMADTTAIYALGHMSVVFRWSPEYHGQQLMALWAPLLLVHLGGQDNISAYAIEDNRLWLRHLQTFVLQVTAAGYVLYVSSIISHPMLSSNNNKQLSWAAILMLVVGVLKYGERIWALKRANSCASSSLFAKSYDNKQVSLVYRTAVDSNLLARATSWDDHPIIVAYSLLDVPKQMFEGSTSYVQFNKFVKKVLEKLDKKVHEAEYMSRVVGMQLSMMYDLLYTKAAVVHTWYGLCSRLLISLPFTVVALLLFRSSSMRHGDIGAVAATGLDYYSYKRSVDAKVTIVLLVGAVVLETMSVLRAIFSKWTAFLMYERGWNTIGDVVFSVIVVVTREMERLVGSRSYSSVRMRQHSLFALALHTDCSIGSKMAKRMRVEDWWDSNIYSWSTEVSELVIQKVLELVSSTATEDITRTKGLSALQRRKDKQLPTWVYLDYDKELAIQIWKMTEKLKLEERILVWHIATHVYLEWFWYQPDEWFRRHPEAGKLSAKSATAKSAVQEATEDVANYMFFLLAARPYMLPYPVSRQAYVQLCSDAVTRFRRDCSTSRLLNDIRDLTPQGGGQPSKEGPSTSPKFSPPSDPAVNAQIRSY